jgi:hypothetical protein
VEAILKAYMDESIEEDVVEEIKEEVTHEPIIAESVPPKTSGVSFNDIDYVKTENGVSGIPAPKNVERLEEISAMRNEQRKNAADDDNNEKLTILEDSFNLDNLDIHNIEEPQLELLPDLLIDEIEVLD